MALQDPLVWIDCEMTGLDADKDEIIEICCFVSDGQLRRPPGDTGFQTVVHCPAARLAQMDDWCTAHHGASGLTAEAQQSTVTAEQAAAGLLAYIQRHVPQPGVGLLAGNSVHADRAFLRRAPYDAVLRHLHYRILDVSSLKEAARRWSGGRGEAKGGVWEAEEKDSSQQNQQTETQPPLKTEAHRARQDILESMEEARYYKERFFTEGGDKRRLA